VRLTAFPKNNNSDEASFLVGDHDEAAGEAVDVLQTGLNRGREKQHGLGGLLGLVDEFNAERRETAGCTGDARFDFAFGAGDSGESRDRFSETV